MARMNVIMGMSEAEFAAWWATGAAVGHDLPTQDGRVARVLFPGRPGTGVGPDFRDAVVLLAGDRRCGAIELHLRAANWYAHHHQDDPRYDCVVLHVVAGGALPTATQTRLACGAAIPIISVGHLLSVAPQKAPMPWPCQDGPPPDMAQRLAAWGSVRFEERVARFRAALARPAATLDGVLLAGMGEALGYGRAELVTDRLRQRRMAGLTALLPAWQAASPGAVLCGAVLAGGAPQGWERLLRVLTPAGNPIGPRRGAIILWNVVLPILAAYGEGCGNPALARLARVVAHHAPGLPANTITHHMVTWLGLAQAPRGALAQQGLHHLHAHWCQTKTCAACPARRH
jgi:hypothetical protein